MKCSLHKLFFSLLFLFCFSVFGQAQNAWQECVRKMPLDKFVGKEQSALEVGRFFRGEAAKLDSFYAKYNSLYGCFDRLEKAKANSSPQDYEDPSLRFKRIRKNIIEGFSEFFDYASGSVESKIIMAQIALLLNETLEAARWTAQATALDGRNYEAYFVGGLAKFATDEGLQNAERAIELKPDFAPAYALRAEILLNRAGEFSTDKRKPIYEQAYRDIQKYLSLAPDSSRASFWRGQQSALKLWLDSFPDINSVISPNEPKSTGIKITVKPRAHYTDPARISQTTGTVRLQIWFDKSGKVSEVLILKSLPFGLTEQAVSAAERIAFEPAAKDGKPFISVKIVEYSFLIY